MASILGTSAEPAKAVPAMPVVALKRKKRKMSAAAKAKISAAQKERWAKKNGVQKTEATPAILVATVKEVPPVKSTVKHAKKGKVKGGKPAVTKEGMIELLKKAGKNGITVKDVASKLGVKSQRIYVWFGVTGKRVKQIKKIAPGKYAWVA